MPRGSSPIDMTGQRFGRYVVIRRDGVKSHMAAWLCRCDCGNERTVIGTTLRNGRIRRGMTPADAVTIPFRPS